MEKTLILVASPPACGKTYVSRKLSEALGGLVYLDKDDLCDLLRAAFKVANQPVDMDGAFYIENLRGAEYATILHIAFSTLQYGDRVLLNAPFGKEVRDPAFMRSLKDRANAQGARLLLIWVTAPLEVCHARMQQRNSDRDTLKLADWEAYVKKINYAPPYELAKQAAVDELILFDTKDDEAFQASMEQTIKTVLGEEIC